eukprot:9377099-Pyramimonas_sp.AAC.2
MITKVQWEENTTISLTWAAAKIRTKCISELWSPCSAHYCSTWPLSSRARLVVHAFNCRGRNEVTWC